MKTRIAILTAILLIGLPTLADDGPKATLPEPSFSFGKVLRGSVVEHQFAIRNTGNQPLAIKNVVMSAPLKVLRMPATVQPGEEVNLKFSLDTTQIGSYYEGVIVVTTNDPTLPQAQLTFDGNVISNVEVSPMPAFYVASQRGEAKEASVEIVNHEADPLRIQGIDSPSERFAVRVEAIVEGQRYRVVLRMNPAAPLGKNTEFIRIHTSSARYAVLQLGAHTYVRDQVYTFPPTVEFGEMRMEDLQAPEGSERSTQRLLVYEAGGKDFKVQLSSDLPFLKLVSQRAPTGDRFQVFVSLDPEKVIPGSFNGNIQIVTNDAKVGKLNVPVSLRVVN